LLSILNHKLHLNNGELIFSMSGEWYGAYVALARRLEDPGVIESLVRDMLKHLVSAPEPTSGALCCGVDLTGTHALMLLARRVMPRKELLTIDIEMIVQSETPEICRELIIETPGMLLFSSDDKGRSPCLSWGGVHHESSGYHCLSILGNLVSLAQEFRGRERIAIIAHCGDYREQGMVPTLIALAKALDVPAFVYTSLPIKFAIAPRFHARAGMWRHSPRNVNRTYIGGLS
jgi:hypothetical protein